MTLLLLIIYPTLQWKKVTAKATQNTINNIDFHSILNASHSVSEEIVLSKLLSKLMSILSILLEQIIISLLLPKRLQWKLLELKEVTCSFLK